MVTWTYRGAPDYTMRFFCESKRVGLKSFPKNGRNHWSIKLRGFQKSRSTYPSQGSRILASIRLY